MHLVFVKEIAIQIFMQFATISLLKNFVPKLIEQNMLKQVELLGAERPEVIRWDFSEPLGS